MTLWNPECLFFEKWCHLLNRYSHILFTWSTCLYQLSTNPNTNASAKFQEKWQTSFELSLINLSKNYLKATIFVSQWRCNWLMIVTWVSSFQRTCIEVWGEWWHAKRVVNICLQSYYNKATLGGTCILIPSFLSSLT